MALLPAREEASRLLGRVGIRELLAQQTTHLLVGVGEAVELLRDHVLLRHHGVEDHRPLITLHTEAWFGSRYLYM